MLKTATLVLAITILPLAGCGKNPSITKGRGPTDVIDLGVVELSANTPKRLSLGEGKECTLTAVSVANGNLQIKMETKEKLAGGDLPPGMPAGTPVERMQTATMTVPNGVWLLTSIGQRPLRFTPMLRGQ
jgi:hypothetical protein